MLSRISIIIPAYNEESRIIPSLEKLKDVFIKNKSDIEILVGDDGSKDETVRILKEFAKTNPWYRLVELEKNQGKGATLRELVAETKGDIVLYTDADLPVDPLEFYKLIDPISSGEADLVQVSRWLEASPKVVNLPLYRNVISQLFRLVIKIMKQQLSLLIKGL